MGFEFRRLDIPDVVVVETDTHRDGRGLFRETYRRTEFARAGIDRVFVQDNLSVSRRGVLRGLHFQRDPGAQAKLVAVPRGRVFDVAVDIRPGSPTFGRWVGQELDGESGRMLFVPEGFAHGYAVLSDEADVLYRATAEYAPELEGGIRWDDPDLRIEWPVPDPVVSARDRALPLLRDLQGEGDTGVAVRHERHERAAVGGSVRRSN